jgi:hypothetical protein
LSDTREWLNTQRAFKKRQHCGSSHYVSIGKFPSFLSRYVTPGRHVSLTVHPRQKNEVVVPPVQ